MRNIEELIEFLQNQMSMSEVYQPAIILYLLEHEGSASKRNLAEVLSGYDPSVQEYYQRILMRWPKATLTKHDVIRYNQKAGVFLLNFSLDREILVEEAKRICEQKIRAWILRRPADDDTMTIAASKCYRVLKAARGKCELCGISAKVSPMDIDHIVPRARADRHGYVVKDGVRMRVDDERNLQALCFRCNRAKRDKDSTDFRLRQDGLVRDRTPEIILTSGRTPVTQTVAGSKLQDRLLEKLVEKHASLLANMTPEEVVEMIEVLLSLAGTFGYSEDMTLNLLREERAERGGYANGIVLLGITTAKIQD